MIQVFTNNPASILAGGDLQFTGFKARRGCTTSLNSGGIALNSAGIYVIVANFSFAATEAGDVTISLRDSGIVSDVDIATATAAEGGIVNLTIPSLIVVRYEDCGCGNFKQIAYQVDVAGTLISANAIVTKSAKAVAA